MPATFMTGTVVQTVPDKKGYWINPDGNEVETEQYARPLDTGIHRPYTEDDNVLCVYLPSMGWCILGKVMQPHRLVVPDDDVSAETLEEMKDSKQFAEQVSGIPPDEQINYRDPREEIDYPGEIRIGTTENSIRIKLTEGGDFIIDTEQFVEDDAAIPGGSLLSFLMNLFNKAVRLRLSEIGIDVVPGGSFILKQHPATSPVSTPAEGEAYTDGVTDVEREGPKYRLDATLASDPNQQSQIDFSIEAGRCRDLRDFQTGASQKTTAKQIKRGMKFKIGDFAFFEIDLDNREIRLSIVDPDQPQRFQSTKFQLRLNTEEFTVTRPNATGEQEQFISLRDEGFFIKSELIGLGGPFAMWSAADLATLKASLAIPQGLTTPDKVIGKWSELRRGLNLAGVSFGTGDDPAVTLPFLVDYYAALNQDLQNIVTELISHVHPTTSPGAPTAVSVMPNTTAALPNFIANATLFNDPTGEALSKLNVISIYV